MQSRRCSSAGRFAVKRAAQLRSRDFGRVRLRVSHTAAVHHAGHAARLLFRMQRHSGERTSADSRNEHKRCKPLRHHSLETILSAADACQGA